MRFSRQDGANDNTFWTQLGQRQNLPSGHVCRMGQDDPGDQGDLSNIMHLKHKELL